MSNKIEKIDMWKTKNGRLILMSEMKRSHLINSYELFKNSGKKDRIRMLRRELARRGMQHVFARTAYVEALEYKSHQPEFDSLEYGCDD